MDYNFNNFLTYIFISLTVIFIIQYYFFKKRYPPGPTGLPLVGYWPFLRTSAHAKLHRLGKKYGNIFTISLGTTKIVVLNDWEAVRLALVNKAKIFSGRPPLFVFDSHVKKQDVATGEGPLWKVQRAFFITTMKAFTSTTSDSEAQIMEATQKFLDTVETYNGKVMIIEDQFYLIVLDVVWRLACNRVMSENEEKGKEFFRIVKTAFANLGMNSLLNFLPFLRFVIPGGLGYWKHQRNLEKLFNYLRREVQEHVDTFKEGHYRDFTDRYIAEIKSREAVGKGVPPFIIDHLVATLFDLFLGGTETTSGTLTWAFLYLALWPKIQLKIQQEIDDVIGRGRMPCLQDQSTLPYFEAFLLEVHRFTSIVPLSFLHTTSEETVILGHVLPKNTVILQNIYGVHNDPKQWKDPETFNPDRHLDSNNVLKKPDCVIPFSVGPRLCPGETIAKNQIFLVTCSLLQKYSFELPPNSPRPSLDAITGLTLAPHPYPVLIKAR